MIRPLLRLQYLLPAAGARGLNRTNHARQLRAPRVPSFVTLIDNLRAGSCTNFGNFSRRVRRVRFIHIADVHLDTAFAGHSDSTRRRLRRASREAFTRCTAAAVSEQVDALLVAGDLFDSDRLSFDTERFLQQSLAGLASAGIQVIYATGNHDPGPPGRAAELLQGLDPDRITVITDAQPVSVPVRNRSGDPAGFVTAAGHTSPRETSDLAAAFKPVAGTSLPQVALLHTQVTGARDAEVHRPYAPSQLTTLKQAGFHYWALGHVHQRQRLSDNPPAHYPGNLVGRNPRETGPKGGLLVDLGDPSNPVVAFRAFAPIRWEKLALPRLRAARTLDALVLETAEAWETARTEDPDDTDTDWLVAIDLEGPSPLWHELRTADDIEVLEEEIAERLDVLDVQIRAQGVYPEARVAEHVKRQDVLGAALRIAQDVLKGEDDLGLSEDNLAGFDPERDGTLSDYLRDLMSGGPEEVLTRMLDSGGNGE